MRNFRINDSCRFTGIGKIIEPVIKALSIPETEPLSENKEPAHRVAGRATASAGKHEQARARDSLFDLSCFRGSK
jgi:hypothetical protein